MDAFLLLILRKGGGVSALYSIKFLSSQLVLCVLVEMSEVTFFQATTDFKKELIDIISSGHTIGFLVPHNSEEILSDENILKNLILYRYPHLEDELKRNAFICSHYLNMVEFDVIAAIERLIPQSQRSTTGERDLRNVFEEIDNDISDAQQFFVRPIEILEVTFSDSESYSDMSWESDSDDDESRVCVVLGENNKILSILRLGWTRRVPLLWNTPLPRK